MWYYVIISYNIIIINCNLTRKNYYRSYTILIWATLIQTRFKKYPFFGISRMEITWKLCAYTLNFVILCCGNIRFCVYHKILWFMWYFVKCQILSSLEKSYYLFFFKPGFLLIRFLFFFSLSFSKSKCQNGWHCGTSVKIVFSYYFWICYFCVD